MIPERTKAALERYVKDREPRGEFLMAVLSNKLAESIHRADNENLAALQDIVRYIYWEIPMIAWGSEAKVEAWLRGDHLEKNDETE